VKAILLENNIIGGEKKQRKKGDIRKEEKYERKTKLIKKIKKKTI